MAISKPVFYEEFLEFLVEKLTPEEIIAFQASEEAQARAHDLLDRNNAGTLTIEEREELNQMLQFERMFGLLKARAFKTLSKK